uniref:Uncharacterized protein n=1 Tax=Rhizophora mucronata TaxID=61149 RepID=A0A2P2IL45_RHIMU
MKDTHREKDFPAKFAFFLMGFLEFSSLVKSVPDTTVMSCLGNGNAYVVDNLESGTATGKLPNMC